MIEKKVSRQAAKPQFNRAKGLAAEALVSQYFENLGYTLLAQNFYIRGGELDLVFLSPSQECVVFVEVRSSSSTGLFLAQSIRSKKRACLRKSIFLFLRRNQRFAKAARRFDVAWVRDGTIEHWKNVVLF